MSVVGSKITAIRAMTTEELQAEGWTPGMRSSTILIEFDDGTKLYPSRDSEGNAPGAMFGVDTEGRNILLGVH